MTSGKREKPKKTKKKTNQDINFIREKKKKTKSIAKQ